MVDAPEEAVEIEAVIVDGDGESNSNVPQVEPEQNVVVEIEPQVDTSAHFHTDKKFKDRDALIAWVRGEAAKLHFSVVIVKSDFGSDRRKQSLVLGCESGGVYRQTNKKPKFDQVGTRKCGYKFRLRGYFHVAQEWNLTVVSGIHNHIMDRALEAHLVAGRLKPKEKQLVVELTRNLIPPRNIMSTLKERNPQNSTLVKQVYNVIHREKVAVRGSMTEMQQLFKCLGDNNYVCRTRTIGESTIVQDIFFSHPKSISLFNSFPSVLIMDCTYKTNRYKMPLFEIVGVTSTNMTFSVGFVLLKQEKEENYTWALQACRGLLSDKDIFPKVIVTDRQDGLMNAVKTVFPEATPLVCSVHVRRNVKAKMKTTCFLKDGDKQKQQDLWDNIERSYEAIMFLETEEEYAESLEEFKDVCKRWPRFVSYLERTVLNTDKQKLVPAWTNCIMHFGNTTTNRVESAHGRLNKYLTECQNDFVRLWESIHKSLVGQFTEIQGSFGRSLSVAEHRHKGKILYKHLVFKVSREALELISKEEKRVEDVGMDPLLCHCVLTATRGLPCACHIATKIHDKLPITLNEVNNHWKKLVFNDGEAGEVEDDYLCLEEINAIQERLKNGDSGLRAELKEALRHLAWPVTTNLIAPPVVSAKLKGAKTKGAKSKGANSTTREPSYWEHVEKLYPDTRASQSTLIPASQASTSKPKSMPRIINKMPKFMHPYVDDIIDVVGDGFCGFRVFALDDGKTEEEYYLVQLAMARELRHHKPAYEKLFGRERYDEILNAMAPPEDVRSMPCAPEPYWFQFPCMGHVVANYYNKVVVLLTNPKKGVSETFFPWRTKPPSNPSSRLMSLLLVGPHFLYVKLKSGCPLPRTCLEWRNHRTEQATAWEYTFMDRQVEFERLLAIERPLIAKIGIGHEEDKPYTID